MGLIPECIMPELSRITFNVAVESYYFAQRLRATVVNVYLKLEKTKLKSSCEWMDKLL